MSFLLNLYHLVLFMWIGNLLAGTVQLSRCATLKASQDMTRIK